jgi:hypothetical protein
MLALGPSCVPPGAAAQPRMVSVVRIRLDSHKSMRPFKGIICDDISEFESYHLSHAVGSLCTPDGFGCHSRAQRKPRVSGKLMRRRRRTAPPQRTSVAVDMNATPCFGCRRNLKSLRLSINLDEDCRLEDVGTAPNVGARPADFVGDDDRARQRWRTRRVNQYRMLFGSISTAA